MTRIPLIWILGLAILIIASSGCATVRSVHAASSIVIISNFAFNPGAMTILQGDNVTWQNNDLVVYTLWFTNASDGSTFLLSTPISPGASWSHVFNTRGLLKYYDFDKLWINATLYVLANGSVGGQVVHVYPTISGLQYTFPTIVGLASLALLLGFRTFTKKRGYQE